MKVGIYPGAFDPIHDGHVAFARTALAAHNLDRLFFLPEPSPRYKQGVKSLQHRLAMTDLAIASEPRFGVIRLEQSRFTVHETWPLLTARFSGVQLYMLLGSDAAARLVSWPHIAELTAAMPHFVIALRGNNARDTNAMLQTLQQTKKLQLNHSLVKSDYPTYGSRKVRQSLKRGYLPQGLHPDVLTYIQEQGLYISGAT